MSKENVMVTPEEMGAFMWASLKKACAETGEDPTEVLAAMLRGIDELMAGEAVMVRDEDW